MPIYEYACSKCEKTNDVMQKVSDPAPATCPSCGAEGTLSRQVSRTSFVLKGGGWYSDLYGSTKKSESSNGDAGTAKASGTEGDSAAKSSTAATPSTPAAPAAPASSGAGGEGTAKKSACA